MISVKVTLSGFYVDKPVIKMMELDPEQNAVQLPTGEILKVKNLKKEALDQYFYEKYIKNTGMDGRIIKIEFNNN